MRVIAAVDIGSNSVRLKIAQVVRHRLKSLHEDREVTRLGESVYRSGVLSAEAMEATIQVLRRFHRAVQREGAERVRVVATSALRDARNASTFVAWVHSATGWKMETITGLEEGRLIHLGLMTQPRLRAAKLLLADLGGGSCELTVSHRGHILAMVSMPLGAVRMTQEFLLHDPPWDVELRRLRKNIADEIDRVARRILAAGVKTVLATSGTAAAIARAARAVETGGGGSHRGSVSRARLARLTEELARLDAKARTKLPGIGPRRAEIIVAGTLVFAELMERCHLATFRYSPFGLRDGVLAQMLAEYDRAALSRRQIEAERADALEAMCRQYRVDMLTAERVRRMAVELFRELRRVHELPAEYETWLAAAAMLHNVGSFINRSGRHRHTYYLIANSEIFGFTPEERRVIAAVARYLGKSRPDPDDPPLEAVRDPDREHVPRAVVLLRLARALAHGASVRSIAASIDRDRVLLKLAAPGDTDLELWMLRREAGYFREVFGRELAAQLV